MTVNKGGITETYAPSSWLCGGEGDQVPGYTIHPLLSWENWQTEDVMETDKNGDRHIPKVLKTPKIPCEEKALNWGVGDKRSHIAGFSPGKLVSI